VYFNKTVEGVDWIRLVHVGSNDSFIIEPSGFMKSKKFFDCLGIFNFSQSLRFVYKYRLHNG
jgi:hypothetical protein